MPRRQAGKWLTRRDHAILSWIGQSGIAAESQLVQRFWPGRQIATAQNHLTQLVKAGYLARQVCDVRQPGEVVYSLTPSGQQVFAGAEREHLQVGWPADHEIVQQLIAQDVRLHLEACLRQQGGRLLLWRSERVLRAAFYRAEPPAGTTPGNAPAEIADAQAVIIGSCGARQEIDIEIDGQYYGRMLREKIARFGQGGRPTLWVCRGARAGQLRQLAQAFPNIQILVL